MSTHRTHSAPDPHEDRDTRAVRPRPSRWQRFLLLVAAFGAAAGWAFHLFGSYLYVAAACAGAPMWGLHLGTVVALGMVVIAALVSASLWRERFRPEGTYLVSARQLGVLGLLLALFFGALVLLQGVPNFVTDPCVGLGLPVPQR